MVPEQAGWWSDPALAMINGGTSLVGLLGNPVRHSLSPVMQNAALESMGLNWRYLALPCDSENLDQVLKGLKAVGCLGGPVSSSRGGLFVPSKGVNWGLSLINISEPTRPC